MTLRLRTLMIVIGVTAIVLSGLRQSLQCWWEGALGTSSRNPWEMVVRIRIVKPNFSTGTIIKK